MVNSHIMTDRTKWYYQSLRVKHYMSILGGIDMNEIIKLPNLEAVQEFVQNAEETGQSVLVSKEGFKNQIDGTSIVGMVGVVGERINVEYITESGRFKEMIKKYKIS